MESKKQALSTEAYKGVRDFFPQDMFVQKYIFRTMRTVVESFGYVEYGASVLEPADLYRGKTSSEIVNEQTYTFTDRGEREVTLRPEMTPTVARMIAGKRHELATPIRWYSIPNLFRYERPQRGRLREHWQLNADMFGVSDIEAEIEMVTIAYRIMIAFGVKPEQFEIRVNNRAHVQQELAKLVKDESLVADAIRLIDRKEKMKPEQFDSEWTKLSNKPFVVWKGQLDDFTATLQTRGVVNCVFDPFLMRGFDYYTGIVFEVFDKNPENNRSLFGGGRYDNLLSLFGGDSIPAVGFGMGDVTMRDVLETYQLLPTYRASADLYLCRAQGATIANLNTLADRLRAQGVFVAVDITERKIGDQIRSADKQKIPFITVIGEEELKSHTYKIKKLSNGEEQTLPEDGIAAFVSTRT